MFDIFDVNKDGRISFEEIAYAFADYFYCGGPDSIYNGMFGDLLD